MLTTSYFKEKKQSGGKISMLTAYDYTTAKLIDESGVDAILVGDSLGMVMLGYDSTLPVTVDDMIHHAAAVARGCSRAFVVADMPFMSYQISVEEAMRNAGRIMKETGVKAVKLEGGRRVCPQVEAIVAAGIPVMGHLGLTPQSVNAFGGFKVQGKDLQDAKALIDDALALQQAGAFSVVLECIPAPLAALITEILDIPTIGIGAGCGCDGQVLVYQDMLQMYSGIKPRFVKVFDDIGGAMRNAFAAYAAEVGNGTFPDAGHSYSMDDDAVAALRAEYGAKE